MLAYQKAAGFLYTHLVTASGTRPDTAITSPFVWSPLPSGIRVPDFHMMHGVNDRFAYGDAKSMLRYMSMEHEQLRGQTLLIFSNTGSASEWGVWNPETWLCSLLARNKLTVGTTPLCVVCVRANGNAIVTDLEAKSKLPSQCVKHAGLIFVNDTGLPAGAVFNMGSSRNCTLGARLLRTSARPRGKPSRAPAAAPAQGTSSPCTSQA